MRRWWRACALGGVVALALAGCGTAEKATAGDQTNQKALPVQFG
ncbi:hypothetical protein [Micromonospora inyonensis]|uniref:Uncharacterized protein n=1 Tax=Micromonospora inyonensis TaxID=47866 RepID=A0A1C6SJK1_9ACTN|nr:hypothetical protein [Micromonospora inyonensis]SCL29598.1 hypothetical protein GA0074694_5447 [Micromonospora inyonensis]